MSDTRVRKRHLPRFPAERPARPAVPGHVLQVGLHRPTGGFGVTGADGVQHEGVSVHHVMHRATPREVPLGGSDEALPQTRFEALQQQAEHPVAAGQAERFVESHVGAVVGVQRLLVVAAGTRIAVCGLPHRLQ